MSIEAFIPVTVIVSTKNEEFAITKCLSHLQSFEQVVVVDSQSDDRTQELARAANVEVIDFAWDGNYPKKKQWSLKNVNIRNEWVLFVDADEIPSPELCRELLDVCNKDQPHDAFDIKLDYYFQGSRLRHGHRVSKRALLRHKRTHFPVLHDLPASGMGELEGHYQPIVDGTVGNINSMLIHRDPDPLASWVARHNRYSDWEAFLRVTPEVRKQVRALRSSQGSFFDRMPFKPFTFFVYSYVVRAGWRDGQAGFGYAFALSFYYWLIEAKTRETRRAGQVQ